MGKKMMCSADPLEETISYEEWVKKYIPIKNPINGSSPFDGYMFETYGPEVMFVADQKNVHVWTVIDTDNGVAAVSGLHFVNRLGYFICCIPIESPKALIEVYL